MTKKDKYNEHLRQIKILEDPENAVMIDNEDIANLSYYKTLTINDFQDETEDEFQQRKNEFEKIKTINENINISINKNLLNKIKSKCNDFSSLINNLLTQYADGKIAVSL
ncbi:MAG: hypothetical protein Ta2D_00410 [Rickettsiales bacterium]|nr:MAG: hypothetical protein Ta2D_00410 [Rickettsiales bacterium]